MGKVPIVAEDAESANGQSKGFDKDVVFPQACRYFGGGDDGGGGTVADPAAVEESKGPGDHGGVHDLFFRDLALEVGLGVQGTVVVVLGGYLGEGALAILVGDAVLVEVPGGRHGELGRWRSGRRNVGTGSFGYSKAGKAGILEFFHTQRENNVVDAGGHSVAGVAEGVGGRGTGVFDAGDGDVVQLEGFGQGLPGAEGADGAKPGGLNVGRIDPGVLECLIGGFDHEVRGAGIPPLPELGTTHSDDCHTITNAVHPKPPKCYPGWIRPAGGWLSNSSCEHR